MSENSKISWTDHTFNIAWGCEEVSPACDNCYAREFSKRLGLRIWNDNPRRTFGEKHWNEPLKWNRKAEQAGKQQYVFCSSMCDIYEVHPTIQQELKKLPPLVQATPSLIWLLLTKRWNEIKRHTELTSLANVMQGVTVEQQEYVHRIVDGVTWISAEPLLGPLDMGGHIRPKCMCCNAYLRIGTWGGLDLGIDSEAAGLTCGCRYCWHCSDNRGRHEDHDAAPPHGSSEIKWIIVGGESGHNAREMKLEWALNLIEQCKAAGVAVHFKQTGDALARKLGLKDKSGKNPDEWPADLQIQEFPAQPQAATP